MSTYQIIVGNVGTTYEGDDINLAISDYWRYVQQSQSRGYRASQEDVTMLVDGDIEREYSGVPVPDTEAMTITDFNDAWRMLEYHHLCDSCGGCQHDRVLQEWIAAGKPNIPRFIIDRANVI